MALIHPTPEMLKDLRKVFDDHDWSGRPIGINLLHSRTCRYGPIGIGWRGFGVTASSACLILRRYSTTLGSLGGGEIIFGRGYSRQCFRLGEGSVVGW
jgi:hypothetical protein